jgi:hypothetical protein
MAPPKGHPPYPGCETGGRPKIYTTEFIDKLADELDAWIQQGKFLWFERFAIQNNLNPEYMSDFARENDKFRQVYNKARAYQRVILFEGGLLKKFQYNAMQLILGNQYGIFEKKETHMSGNASLSFVLDDVDGETKNLIQDDDE